MNERALVVRKKNETTLNRSSLSGFTEMMKPLLSEANAIRYEIARKLKTAPAFINAVKAVVPEDALCAVLNSDQKERIAKGALKLMSRKDGSLLAKLVDPKTGKIVANIPLKSVKLTPELSKAVSDFSMCMQLGQIAEQIDTVQAAIEEVHAGQEQDRLSTAYSCRQKLRQALKIHDPKLRQMALLQLVSSAEDSRNLLMLSQKANLAFIMDQPERFIQKIISGASPEKINERMNEIRESLYAVNAVSITAAIAYYELGEREAARKSLTYYAAFLHETYISSPRVLERLDMIDPSPVNYWSISIPVISTKIKMMPTVTIKKFPHSEPKRRNRK